MLSESISLREFLTGNRKVLDEKVTGKDTIEILDNLREEIKGFSSRDLREKEEFDTLYSEARNLLQDTLTYLEENFSSSKGEYKVFRNRNKEQYEHKINLWKKVDYMPSVYESFPLSIRFSTPHTPK